MNFKIFKDTSKKVLSKSGTGLRHDDEEVNEWMDGVLAWAGQHHSDQIRFSLIWCLTLHSALLRCVCTKIVIDIYKKLTFWLNEKRNRDFPKELWSEWACRRDMRKEYTMLAAKCETFHGDKCVVFGWYKTIFMLKMKNNKRKRALKREVR